MKYEMMLGTPEKFDGHNENAEILLWHDFLGPKALTQDEMQSMSEREQIPCGAVIVAMRRIIKEPKRWAWEDKKAGRLPEVGSIFTYRDETLTCHFIDGDGEIWAHDIDNKIVTPLLRDCQPIETQAEKAQRLRDEWCKKVMDLTPCSDAHILLITAQENQTKRIYDALLSGELQAPTKE